MTAVVDLGSYIPKDNIKKAAERAALSSQRMRDRLWECTALSVEKQMMTIMGSRQAEII